MNWEQIVAEGNLSEEFLIEHEEHINFRKLIVKQQLSEGFIERYLEKWDWKKLSEYQYVSFEFMMKHLERMDLYPALYRNRNKITRKQDNLLSFEKENRKQMFLNKEPLVYNGITCTLEKEKEERKDIFTTKTKTISLQTDHTFTDFPSYHRISAKVITHRFPRGNNTFEITEEDTTGFCFSIPYYAELDRKDDISYYEEYIRLQDAINRILWATDDLPYPFFQTKLKEK